jgi:hypothetical protein
MQKPLQFIPSFYRSGSQFRGVLRVRKNGRMAGTIPCAELHESAEMARADARGAALLAVWQVPGAETVCAIS